MMHEMQVFAMEVALCYSIAKTSRLIFALRSAPQALSQNRIPPKRGVRTDFSIRRDKAIDAFYDAGRHE